MNNKKTLNMTEGNPTKLILWFALPLIIGNLFQQGYILVDSVIIGRWVGVSAFSAVGITSSLITVIIAMCMGVTIGMGVVISQYFGAKDEKNIIAAIINGIYVCTAMSVLMTIFGFIFTRPLLVLLNTPESLMRDAVTYMSISMCGIIAITAYYSGFSILRALGDSKTPLIFMIIANVLNVGLTLLFVVSFGMGVAGAAITTIISQIIAATLCFIYAYKTLPYFKMAFHNAKLNKKIALQTLKIGLPSGFQFSLIFISGSVLQRVVNGFGEIAIGAFTATNRLQLFIEQPLVGLSAAITTYTGQNVGAGRIDRVKLGIQVSVWITLIYSFALMVFFWTVGHIVMRIFVSDIEIISLANTGMRITSIFFIMMGMVRILRSLLNGAGDAIYSMVNGFIEIIGRIGLAFILTNITFIGVWGIWYTTGFTWLITCLFAIWRYKSGVWTKKSLVEAKQEN